MQHFQDYYTLIDIFDVILLDVIIPEMNGDEALEKILKINPDAKVIFMSGYSKSTIVERYNLDESINFVQKPFEIKKVLSLISQVIGN